MSENPTERKTPPENDDDWRFLWRSAARANDGWIVVGPIVAAVKNWKAWLLIGGGFVWLNKPEIMQALSVFFGGHP